MCVGFYLGFVYVSCGLDDVVSDDVGIGYF